MDGRVNIGLAIGAVIMIIAGGIASAAISFSINYNVITSMDEMGMNMPSLIAYGIGYYLVIVIIGAITMILLFIVLKEIMDVLNRNIENTRALLASVMTDDTSVKSEVEAAARELKDERIQGWAFWGYFISYIVGLIFTFVPPVALTFGVAGLIFFLIYLHQIFSTSTSIYTIKIRAYSYLKNMKGLPQIEEVQSITKRNVFLVLILMIVTFGIYWLYLIVKLPSEVNEFVQTDEAVRTKLA